NEWINNSSLLVGHRFGSESFKVQSYYNVDFLLFKNNKDLNNYSHKFGISSTWLKDDLTINAAVFAKIDKSLLNVLFFFI
ncbi:hypothetical protein, partial [Nitrosomonas sp.]|uniref:hypothetical protein n=1 Tax=Nitrosomonas sp. TaxID=42353 RepID=UPI00272F3792